MAPLSLSRTSLTGRLMLAFSVLGVLLMLLVSLGSLSLHWLKQADSYLYEESLPASQAARQLVQASNALSDGVQQLGRVEDERQREFIGRKLSLESVNMFNGIKTLTILDVNEGQNLNQLAEQIISQLTSLGKSVGRRLTMGDELQLKAHELSIAAGHASELLQSELAVVNSAILAKLSQAYPDMAGAKRSGRLLDDVIEGELDIQEQLNRALKLVHQIALLSQLFESSELQSELQLSVPKLLATFASTNPSPSFTLPEPEIATAMERALAHKTDSALTSSDINIDLMALDNVPEIIRDPGRLQALKTELAVLSHTPQIIKLQRELSQTLQQQQRQQQELAEKLYGLNTLVDRALNQQQQQAELARSDYLHQLSLARLGLWGTGALMFVVIGFVIYRVIYRGIALRLNQATSAMSRLSLGDTDVSLEAHGDDELTAMANAIEAFKRKTAHNLKLQADLRQVADELTEHKKALEQTVAARTQELADTNNRLDAEAKGHAKARQIAEEASQAKSQFLATMSHEIRTPLNGLLGTLTLLGHSDLPPAQQQMLALSQYSGTLLQTVLNDILDFSRLEQGKLSHEPRPTDINSLLDEVLAIMVAGANLAGLSLKMNKPKLPSCINIDGPKLRQVLFNLIGNGIKFTQEGGVTLSVSLQGTQLSFVVQDTGVGIAPAALDKLFVPYSALPNQGRSRGTGLGLAICKQLVELMDASGRGIWVKSQPGKGSEFGFELAFNECDMTYVKAVTERVLVPTRQVLVVEDNKVNAMVAQGFLAHLGHKSVLAVSCQQALEFVESNGVAFDAVMLDIQLSDGSGIDLLPQLKMLIANPSVKFAAFTAQMQSEDLQHYREAGFDTVLAKPLSLQTLTEWLGVAASPLSASISSSTVNDQLSAPLQVATVAKIAATIADVDDEPLLDLKQLAQDKDVLGSEAMMSMLDLFSDSSREQLAKLSLANPKEEVAKLLHGLKGSSASMGLIALAKLCKELELALKASANNALELSEFQRLESCWQTSIAALSQWLAAQND